MAQEAFEIHKIRNALHIVYDGVEAILRSYSLHANAYVTKPVDFDRFTDVVRQIDDFLRYRGQAALMTLKRLLLLIGL
jgi:hypothetical protein